MSIFSDGEKTFLSTAGHLLDDDEVYSDKAIESAVGYFKRANITTEDLADIMGLLSIYFGQGTMAAHLAEGNPAVSSPREITFMMMKISCLFAAISVRLENDEF